MATAVTDILKQILIAQGRRTLSGQDTVRQILEALRKQVITEFAVAPADSFSAYRQQQLLREIDRHLHSAEVALQGEISKGIADSWQEGMAMLPQMARAGSNVTVSTFGISTHLVDQIKEFAWGRITSVKNDAQARIRAELSLGVLGQQTPQEVASAIAGTLARPGVFKGIAERAEVITKVEMGRAFSMAHQATLATAMDSLPGLQKMWLHAGHPKQARPYHLALNGEIKPVDEPFLVGNIAMMYPRDPKAPASEVINCGCLHVAYMEAWGTRAEFLKSWTQAQKAANKRQV